MIYDDPFEPQLKMFVGENLKSKRNLDPRVIASIVKHYHETGFPYIRLNEHQRLEELNELIRLDTTKLLQGREFLSDPTGVALANAYHPHRYEVVCNNHRTAMEVFVREDHLRKCIEKCIHMSGKISDSKLRSMISIFEGVQVASNFPPGTAKAIYDHFVPIGGSVWDPSMGWGGRLLAAYASENVSLYLGTDPSIKTFFGLGEMGNFLIRNTQRKVSLLSNQGSESPLPEHWLKHKVDFVFTSPPYFNTEKYAYEPTQSYIAHATHGDWIRNFIGGTFRNIGRILKDGGKVAINIANVQTFHHLETQTVKQAETEGFKLVDTYYLLYTMMPGKGAKNAQRGTKKHRKEPIFIFERRS